MGIRGWGMDTLSITTHSGLCAFLGKDHTAGPPTHWPAVSLSWSPCTFEKTKTRLYFHSFLQWGRSREITMWWNCPVLMALRDPQWSLLSLMPEVYTLFSLEL